MESDEKQAVEVERGSAKIPLERLVMLLYLSNNIYDRTPEPWRFLTCIALCSPGLFLISSDKAEHVVSGGGLILILVLWRVIGRLLKSRA